MLKYNNSWRYDSPGSIPDGVHYEFMEIIIKAARGKQEVLEHFKKYYASALGLTSYRSSNASWADTDLQNYMTQAKENAPVFIEAFHDACKELKASGQNVPIPETRYINRILAKHMAGYTIDPPNLIASSAGIKAEPPKIPLSLDQKAQNIIQTSFNEAQKLLIEGKGRQAVQELLWLLETVSTAFQGLDQGDSSTIQGKYFNKIIDEIRRNQRGTAFERVIEWIKSLHGYLSAPTGGGVRHGMDLKEGVVMSTEEAKLYCNLIISYISFFLAEYERISR